jgi:PhzF family phenazine biosynthesis protein
MSGGSSGPAYHTWMPSVVHVDAFTDRPFTGNPAAVCVLAGPADAAWMQALAAELNLPATAYVWPQGAEFGLRWFTSVAELSLCGHGTLASAHVLLERGSPLHSAGANWAGRDCPALLDVWPPR